MSSMVGAFFESGAFLPVTGAIAGAALCSQGGPTRILMCAGSGAMLGKMVQSSITDFRSREKMDQRSEQMIERMNKPSGASGSQNTLPRDLQERQIAVQERQLKQQEELAAFNREQLQYLREKEANTAAYNRALLESRGHKMAPANTLDNAFKHEGTTATQAPSPCADQPAAAARSGRASGVSSAL